MEASAVSDAPAATATTCPGCGAPARRGQLVCLECGARVALVYRRPPSWKVPVVITIVVLAIAVALAASAFAAIRDTARHEVDSAPPHARTTSQLPTVGQYLATRSAAALTSGPGSTVVGSPPCSRAPIVSIADAASASTS